MINIWIVILIGAMCAFIGLAVEKVLSKKIKPIFRHIIAIMSAMLIGGIAAAIIQMSL